MKDPALIVSDPSALGKNPVDLVAVLDSYLAEAELSGVDLVRAELARRLALASVTAPDYSLPRLAATMAALLSVIDDNGDAVRRQRRVPRLGC